MNDNVIIANGIVQFSVCLAEWWWTFKYNALVKKCHIHTFTYDNYMLDGWERGSCSTQYFRFRHAIFCYNVGLDLKVNLIHSLKRIRSRYVVGTPGGAG